MSSIGLFPITLWANPRMESGSEPSVSRKFRTLAEEVTNYADDYTGSAVKVMNLTSNDGQKFHQASWFTQAFPIPGRLCLCWHWDYLVLPPLVAVLVGPNFHLLLQCSFRAGRLRSALFCLVFKRQFFWVLVLHSRRLGAIRGG